MAEFEFKLEENFKEARDSYLKGEFNPEKLKELNDKFNQINQEENKYDEEPFKLELKNDKLTLTKGGSEIKFDGKNYGDFLNDYKSKIQNSAENGPNKTKINDINNETAKSQAKAIYGENVTQPLIDRTKIGLDSNAIDIIDNTPSNPQSLRGVTEANLRNLPDINNASDVRRAQSNPVVQDLTRRIDPNDRIKSLEKELQSYGGDMKKVEAKLDELKERCKENSTTDKEKGIFDRLFDFLKNVFKLTGFLLIPLLGYSFLKQYANEESGCFISFKNEKGETTNVQKVVGLTCKDEYKDLGKYSEYIGYTKDCIKNATQPSGCPICSDALYEAQLSGQCPCNPTNNYASDYCSNAYLSILASNPQSNLTSSYEKREKNILDALRDLGAYLGALSEELAKDVKDTASHLLDDLFKYMKIGTILAIVFIVIYGLFWLLREFGFIKGKESAERVIIAQPSLPQQVQPQPLPKQISPQPPSQKLSEPSKPPPPKSQEISTAALLEAATKGDYSKVKDISKNLGGRTRQITEEQRQQARAEIESRLKQSSQNAQNVQNAQNAQNVQNVQNVKNAQNVEVKEVFSSASSPDLPPTLQNRERTPGRLPTENIVSNNVSNNAPISDSTQAVMSGAEGRMMAAPSSPRQLPDVAQNIPESELEDADIGGLLFRPKRVYEIKMKKMKK